MPNKRIRRYLIDIKGANGQSVFFTAADWSDEERRAAITQILRLESLRSCGSNHSDPAARQSA